MLFKRGCVVDRRSRRSGGFRLRDLLTARLVLDSFPRQLLLGGQPVVDVASMCRATFEVPLVGAPSNFLVPWHRVLRLTFRRTATFPFSPCDSVRPTTGANDVPAKTR